MGSELTPMRLELDIEETENVLRNLQAQLLQVQVQMQRLRENERLLLSLIRGRQRDLESMHVELGRMQDAAVHAYWASVPAELRGEDATPAPRNYEEALAWLWQQDDDDDVAAEVTDIQGATVTLLTLRCYSERYRADPASNGHRLITFMGQPCVELSPLPEP